MSLQQLTQSKGHGKSTHYFPLYDSIFEPIRDRANLRIMEIGIGNGNSLRLWKDYFPLATIIGVDNQDGCRAYAEPRIEVVLGDQANPATFANLGQFDIIIDDGGHSMEQQIVSLTTLFPDRLLPGGWYIIEDLHSSYAFNDFYNRATTMDVLWRVLDGLQTVDGGVPKVGLQWGVDEMRFMNGIVAIHKKEA